MAILWQIHQAKNEVLAPIVVDTPNQQEQAYFRYEQIMQFLGKFIPAGAQFILCAMNRDEIASYKSLFENSVKRQ
ncbi:hypothetical protein [Noviherbaspirillum sp.]|uniref:hypothetical protein n=1 Tax=Noviherbaspirillum sp. TaxID=1926288 RepID=UPI002B462492|nr:hypothetical protein [Noviherbaspirillum sp.]HJV80008.1 hypothetical protein [Noviherbaspirillum sp.]